MAEHSPLDLVRHASTWSIIWGILQIVFGVLAIGAPLFAAVAVSASYRLAHHFGRSSPPNPCLSRSSGWQHDLEVAGWTGLFVLRHIPANASGACGRVAHSGARFAVPD